MKRKGFTIVELLVVIILIATLSVISVNVFSNSTTASKEKVLSAKIETIKVAAAGYLDDNTNEYSSCNYFMSQEDIIEKCVIDPSELIERGYLPKNDEKNKDKDITIDPTTNEKLQGKILACYNMNTSRYDIQYVTEITMGELCSNTQVHLLTLQSNSLAITHNETKTFETKIFYYGIEDITFDGENSKETYNNGVHFEIINNSTLKVEHPAEENGQGKKTITQEIIGTYKDSDNVVQRKVINFNLQLNDVNDENATNLVVIIRPSDALKAVSNFQDDITLSCFQANNFGCEIDFENIFTYFNDLRVNDGYTVIPSEYSVNSPIEEYYTFNGQNSIVGTNLPYRIYNTETAPANDALKNGTILYVNTKPNIYTVTFKNGNDRVDDKKVIYGKEYKKTSKTVNDINSLVDESFPVPTKNGHTLEGWYTEESGGSKITESSVVSKTEDHILYAHWTPNQYTITYDGNGNTGGSTSQTTCYYGETCTLGSNGFSKTGHTFAGWYTEESGGEQFGSTTTLTGNITVYAHWTPNQYTITYNGNGNTGGSTSQTTCNYGETCTLRSNGFSKTNYTFAGWYTSASGGNSYGSTTTLSSNITVYAHCSGRRTINNIKSVESVSVDTGSVSYSLSGTTFSYTVSNGYEYEDSYWDTCTTSATSSTATSNQQRNCSCPNGGTLSGETCSAHITQRGYGSSNVSLCCNSQNKKYNCGSSTESEVVICGANETKSWYCYAATRIGQSCTSGSVDYEMVSCPGTCTAPAYTATCTSTTTYSCSSGTNVGNKCYSCSSSYSFNSSTLRCEKSCLRYYSYYEYTITVYYTT